MSVLVLIHEFGHFIIARLCGIGVLEFALGLPLTKPFYSKTLPSGMKVSIYPVLFGGFVSLLGEEGEGSNGDKSNKINHSIRGKLFYKSSVIARIGVVVAGVTMNILLAIVAFYFFLGFSKFEVYLPKIVPYTFFSPTVDKVFISEVGKNTPANKEGLVPGNVVLSVDGREINDSDVFRDYVKSLDGREMVLVVSDTSFAKERIVKVTPRKNPPAGEGALGVTVGELVKISYNTTNQKMLSGFTYTLDMFIYNAKAIGYLISYSWRTNDVSPISEGVSGPIGVYSVIGEILKVGGSAAAIGLINFLGLMSLSLAFMNILPFPALDGGKLAFLLFEALFRKKISPKVENLIHQVGFAILIGLIVLVSFNDIGKFFRK